jgi:hypothetical protein
MYKLCQNIKLDLGLNYANIKPLNRTFNKYPGEGPDENENYSSKKN